MNRPRFALSAVAVGALLLLPAVPAAALELESSITIGDGRLSSVSTDPATGTTLVTWTELGAAIWGAVVDEHLTVLVPPFVISDDAQAVEWSQPYADWNPDEQNWLVAWDDDQSIHGQLISPATGPLGSSELLADHAHGDEAAVFGDIEQVEVSWGGPANGYLVAFKAQIAPEGCQEVLGVLVGADGLPEEGSATTLSSDLPGEDVPDAGCDIVTDNGLGLDFAPAADAWFVAWTNFLINPVMAEGRLIEADGTTPAHVTDPVILGQVGSGVPTVVHDPVGGGFLAAWMSDERIAARFITPAGTLAALVPFFVDAGDLPRLYRPRVAYDPATAMFVVVAHSDGASEDDPNFRVHSFEIGTDATNPGAHTALTDGTEDATRPAVSTGAGCVIATWAVGAVDSEASTEVEVASACAAAAPAAPTLPDTGIDQSLAVTLALLAIAGVAGGAVLVARRQSAAA